MGADELEATFDLRWRELGLEATLQASDATIRPTTGATLAAVDPTEALPERLPRISLDRTGGEARVGSDPGAARADLALVSTLGEGGMGRVHLARQRSLDREVAVKTLKPDAPERARTALLAEATVTGSLEHPGIIPVHALGMDDAGRPLLVMKRVQGTEWRALIHDPDHPAWADLSAGPGRLDAHIEILTQVCNALEFAHSRGVVHRDVKPENVMVGRYGEVYLVDWGIASRVGAVRPGELVGSPGYMAPEMVTGQPVDGRTDVHLLGSTLHEVLTGELRHRGETLQQVLFAAFRSEPFEYPDSVPGELAELCNRATSRDPDARHQSANELRQALLDYRRHRSSVALAAGAAERLAALRQALPEDPAEPVPDTAAAYRLSTECRFGYAQALEEWPGNAGARRGLERCLGLVADLELRQGNAAGARALLAELSSPRSDLEARLAELERDLEDQRRRDERLRRLEHDMDVRVGAPQRARALLLLGLLAVGVSGFALLKGMEQIGTGDMVVFALVILLGSVIGLAVYGRRLLRNAFNRRAAGMIFLGMCGLTASRLVGFATGAAMEETFFHDLLLLCVVAVAAAIGLASWVWPAAVVYAVALGVALLFPSVSALAFSGSCLLVIAYLAVAWRRGAAEAARR